MKATGIILLLLVWQTSFSQFIDSFDDGDLTTNPPWSGKTADFSVINNSVQLTAAPISGTSFLSTPSASINAASWQFSLRMAFNPSSSNYSEVYLVADTPDIANEVNGYLIRMGWTTDNIALIRQDGQQKEVILEGIAKRLDLSSVDLKIKVTRSNAGEWNVYSQLGSETEWFMEGSAIDRTYIRSAYFGIKCNYTSTRSDKFSFDDFVVSGEPYVDTEPPVVDTVYTSAENGLVVVLSEPVNPASVNPKNFIVNGAAAVSAAVVDDSIKLICPANHRVDNTISFDQVQDLAGNSLEPVNYTFIHYSFLPIEFGDIVFNEILPDPSPPVDLPEVEYIEIINSTNRAINMTDWSLSDRTTTVRLPEIKLRPDSIIILAQKKDGLNLLNEAIVLDRWPSLNNAEDELWLRDSSGNLVDYLAYDLSMYGDPGKEEGGWSLERLDPYLPCTGVSNWRASEHPYGGTPGLANSVFRRIADDVPPELVKVYAFSPDSVMLYFSEPLGTLPDEVLIADAEIRSIAFGLSLDEINLQTSPLVPSRVYTLTLSGISDCSGNTGKKISAELVLPDQPEPGDLVINEILFNPIGDRHDYLEVFNQSPKYLSLHELRISNGETIKAVSDLAIIPPGGYRVFSPDPEPLLIDYLKTEPGTIITQELPAFTNEAGIAVIRNADAITLDSIRYDQAWHFGYLNDVEGIALERLSPYRPATQADNWASASAQDNYGTPGYINSQKVHDNASNNLDLDPRVIVPDADGRDDFTTISLHEADGAMVTIRIYNLQGQEINVLANNEFLRGTSYFTWDGTDQQGRLVPLGHYIVTADLIFDNGRTMTYREKMVVGTGY